MDTQQPKRRSLWYWIGLVLIILGIISPLFAALVPLLGLPTAMAATVVGLLILGIPEILLALGGILAGRELVAEVHAKTRSLWRYLGLGRPVGPTRYYVGVSLILLGLAWSLVLDYLLLVGVVPLDQTSRLYLLVAGDSVVIVGFFTAGRPFWEKLKRLLIWTPEESLSAPPADPGQPDPLPALPPETVDPGNESHPSGEAAGQA